MLGTCACGYDNGDRLSLKCESILVLSYVSGFRFVHFALVGLHFVRFTIAPAPNAWNAQGFVTQFSIRITKRLGIIWRNIISM